MSPKYNMSHDSYIWFQHTNPLKIVDDSEDLGEIEGHKEEKSTDDNDLDPLSKMPNYPIWFHRQDPKNRTDGILYIPFPSKLPSKKICWYFVMDTSGSMNTKVYGKKLSRWEVAVKLLHAALDDLKKLNRPHDTVTVITFSTTAKTIVDNAPIQDYNPEILQDIKPLGSTDISLANAATYEAMMSNPKLTQKDHLAVEIFFTDGEATDGLVYPHLLKQQKLSLYTNIQKCMNGSLPFFWCGGISSDANLDIIQALSYAAPHSLWAYIQDEQIENFAAEIGGIVNMVTTMKIMDLPVQKVLAPIEATETKNIMLLPDIPNLFYFKSKPFFAVTEKAVTIDAEHFVSVYKMNEMIYQHTRGVLELEPSDLEDILKRAQNRKPDKNIETSLWRPIFEKTQLTIYQNIDLLQKKTKDTQISENRGNYFSSPAIRNASQKYKTIYSQFDDAAK